MEPTPHLGSAPRPAAKFVGRQTELSFLIDALRSGRSVLVTGVGGIGKTELLVQAIRHSETGRPVFWIDVERYHAVDDILSALRTALGTENVPCSESAVPARLNDLQACVVFDGIERTTVDDIDALEDAIAELYSSTATAQFIATSQVVLHRLSSDARLKVGRLDELSSRQLLESFGEGDGVIAQGNLAPLLEFCEGHALTLRLATALMEHYGGPTAALGAINARGISAVSLPGRKRQNHTTSLELCLQTAYDAVSVEGRQLLWLLAEAPAGLFANYLEGEWLELSDPNGALAELRRWHLVDVVRSSNDIGRTHVLGPIRTFAIERAHRDDVAQYKVMIDRLVHGFGMMVAVLELKYDDPDDTPHVIQRYGEELPNLLHTLDLARVDLSNIQMLKTAVAIAKSLMRYFFVLGLSEQGAKVMHDAAELSLAGGHLKSASGLILQLMALGQRGNSKDFTYAGLRLAAQLEALTEAPEVVADIAMCRGIAAREVGDNAAAANYARKALAGYRSRLRPTVDQQSVSDGNGTEPNSQQDLHNNISSALGLLGFSLLSLGRYEEAADAYRDSLQHLGGSSVAVNRGQTLHQLGNCESYLAQFREAAAHYLEAAKIFCFVGMEEYLSNALSELGYTLLDIEDVNLLEEIDVELIKQGLLDMSRDAKRVFNPTQALDHNRCSVTIRKLFGSVILASLLGQGALLGEFCGGLGNDVLIVFGQQFSKGERDQQEAFPLAMVDLALRLGLLVAEAEQTLEEFEEISRDTIGEMLRRICEAHDWAHTAMRLVDWFAALLTQRWRYRGATVKRLHDFIQNYRDDVVDYFDLTRDGDLG